MTKQTQESWEALCDEGREAVLDTDNGRWRLGDLALRVQKSYGKNRIGDFAKEVNAQVSRVKEYRTVCRFYEKSARTQILEQNPTLSYSHFRLAMRLDDYEEAIDFLMECADGAWTIEAATVNLNKHLKKPVPPPKLLDAEGKVSHVDLETGVVVIKAGEGANLLELAKYLEKEVRVVIHALELEKETENGQS